MSVNTENVFLKTLGLSIGYETKRSGCKALMSDINISCHRGVFYGMMGANGVGKSTLFQVVSGVLPALSGEVELGGRLLSEWNASERALRIAMATTQRPQEQRLTARELVSLGRYPHTNWFGVLSEHDQIRVNDELRMFGLEALAGRHIASLSDGEAARAGMARAFCQDTPLILLDEPMAFLDPPRKLELMALLQKRAHSEQRCIIATLHDIELPLQWCDELLLAVTNRENGTIIQCTPQEALDRRLLQKLYSGNEYFDAYLEILAGRQS